MPLPTDTTPEMEQALSTAYRQMSVSRKWQLLGETFATARSLHSAGVKLRKPSATHMSIRRDWLATSFGYRGPSPLGEPMNGTDRNLIVLCDVLRVLSSLGIAHALGGSMASSLHGIARFTRDADVTVEPFPGKEDAFTAALGTQYYLSLPAVKQAVLQRSSFNVLHTAEGFKVDLFVRKDSQFEKSALERRVTLTLPDIPEQPVPILTAEDVILFKLGWYRLGEEVSQQQWNDVLGVLRVQAGRLDNAYLDRFAEELHVADLLVKARLDSDIGTSTSGS